jgi:hypothetical protein
MDPHWLQWAQRLQAIAQNGLTFATDPFDVERYTALRQIAPEIFAQASTADLQNVLDLFAQQVGYATPKIDVRGVVFRDDVLLLVKEHADQRWTLPGGWADPCESPALQRHLIMVLVDTFFVPMPFDAKGTPGSFAAGPTRPTEERHASYRFLRVRQPPATS